MTTAKQAAANRRNAKKSTGPRTAKGKSIARRNAVRHGLLSEEFIIRGEKPNDLTALQESLQIEFNPNGVLEYEIVDQITVYFWRLRRIRALETGVFSEGVTSDLKNPSIDSEASRPPVVKSDRSLLRELWRIEAEENGDPIPDDEAMPDWLRDDPDEQKETPHEAPRPTPEEKSRRLGRVFERAERTLANLQRYRIATERSLDRALKELARLQAARGGGSELVPITLNLKATKGTGRG